MYLFDACGCCCKRSVARNGGYDLNALVKWRRFAYCCCSSGWRMFSRVPLVRRNAIISPAACRGRLRRRAQSHSQQSAAEARRGYSVPTRPAARDSRRRAALRCRRRADEQQQYARCKDYAAESTSAPIVFIPAVAGKQTVYDQQYDARKRQTKGYDFRFASFDDDPVRQRIKNSAI